MIIRQAIAVSFAFALTTNAPAILARDAAAIQQQQTAQQQQGEGSPVQRLDIARSRLEAMRRTLSGAVAVFENNKEKKDKKDDEAKKDGQELTRAEGEQRLRGLDRDAKQLLDEVLNIRGKVDRAERYEVSDIANLEAGITDLNTRVEEGLRGTAEERRRLGGEAALRPSGSTEKKGGFLSKLNPFGGGGKGKYDDKLTTVAAGRDRELFEDAVKETRKGNYDVARQLFGTIVTTYTESPFLPLSKLAAADTFYLEGTTSALIQANAGYRDWLTFFPTHPLADRVMLKMAEAEMRQMGLPDRDQTHAIKAEQQLKVVLQQFPTTALRPEVEKKLIEVQENRGMHSFQVGNFYYDKFRRGTAVNPRGAQSRYREVVEKYPNFSYLDEVLFNLARTYVDEEEPDEAAKYFQRLLREYPNSQWTEKAGDELDKIGAPRPKVDEKHINRVAPERPGFTQKIFVQLTGVVPKTVDKNGVIISKSDDNEDLIDYAIANRGELPSNLTPGPVINRRAPARVPVQSATRTTPPSAPPTPPPVPAAVPETENNNGISLQPTRPGSPVGTPGVPAQGQPATTTPVEQPRRP